MYYVYEWYLKDTGMVFYVGKGTGNRYKVKKHNRFFDEIIKNKECASRIVETFDNEEEAFQYEFERIEELKAKGQCACNIHRGGTGGTTTWWTQEKRNEYSRKNVMKSEAQRERMSRNNPMKNPVIAEKTNGQKRRPVIINGVRYNSVKEAHEAFGVTTDTIILWCKKGINANGDKCRYEDSSQAIFTGKRYNKGGCRALTYMGKHYETPKDLAEEIGLSGDAVSRWARRGYDSHGNPCCYDDAQYTNDTNMAISNQARRSQ